MTSKKRKIAEKSLNISKGMLYLTVAILLVTVVSLGLQCCLFQKNIKLEKEDKLKSLIADMKSLVFEMETNSDILDTIVIRRRENMSKKRIVDALFSTENLEERISDGRIRNEIIKGKFAKLHSELLQINNFIEALNLDQSSFNLTGEEFKALFGERFILVRDELKDNRLLVNKYIACLESKREIDLCSNPNEWSI